MLKFGRKFRAVEKLDDCRIMGISIYNDDYIRNTKQYFASYLEDPPEEALELSKQEVSKREFKKPNVFEAGSEDAKFALFSLVSSIKG